MPKGGINAKHPILRAVPWQVWQMIPVVSAFFVTIQLHAPTDSKQIHFEFLFMLSNGRIPDQAPCNT